MNNLTRTTLKTALVFSLIASANWRIITAAENPGQKISFIPSNEFYQGEAFRIIIENPKNPESLIIFKNKQYKLFPYQDKFTAIVGLNISEPAGKTHVKIGGKTIPILIKKKTFPIERIKPPKPLPPEDLVKRSEERKNINLAYAVSSLKILFNSEFTAPLDNQIETAAFGVHRLAAGYKSVHRGIDFKAAIGTPIKAINDGTVRIAENYLLEGGFVILDHGLNINSLYMHLEELFISTGEKVKKGQVIGLSGGTGLSRGPHLHFGIKINGVFVDPLKFLTLWTPHL